MRALLVIDVQNGLMKKRLFRKEEFIATINGAIAGSRASGDMVVFVQHANSLLKPETDDWKLFEGLDRRPDDPTIVKRHGNAFEKTDLKAILDGGGVRELLVCGLVSHGCVRATCLGGVEEGFKVLLLKDGHSNWHRDAEAKIRETEAELLQKAVAIAAVGDI